MISLIHQFLFIHIPKTGGNSLQNILRHYSEDEIVCLESHQDGVERFEVRNKKYQIHKHTSLAGYKRKIEPDIYQNLYKFSIIRNPWDRMISYFFSPHRGVTEWNRNEFIDLVQQQRPLRQQITSETLTDKVNKKLGITLLPSFKKSLDAELDYLIRFEHLEQDFAQVCKHIGIPRQELPKRNVSKRQHYSTYYDEELIKLVGHRFQEEISFGQYKFETVSP